MISNNEKLEICKTCARIVKRKRPSCRISIDELINIGFIHIKSSNLSKAYSEAYYNMLHICSQPKFDRNSPKAIRLFIATRRAAGRHREAFEHDLARLMDVQDAILQLPKDDLEIAILYLLLGATQKELCQVLHLSQPTISVKLQGIKDRLCKQLKAYK